MKANIKICMGTHCTMLGNLNLYHEVEELQEQYPELIEFEPVKCLKCCQEGKAPVVIINDKLITNAKVEKIVSEILEVIKE